jgi:hypothetical protein
MAIPMHPSTKLLNPRRNNPPKSYRREERKIEILPNDIIKGKVKAINYVVDTNGIEHWSCPV